MHGTLPKIHVFDFVCLLFKCFSGHFNIEIFERKDKLLKQYNYNVKSNTDF